MFGLVAFTYQLPAVSQSILFPNNFTRTSAVPDGCLSLVPSFLPPPETVFFDQAFIVDGSIGSKAVRVQVWRIGCHEPGRSIIAMNLQAPEFPIVGLIQPFVSLRGPGSTTENSASLSLFSSQDGPSGVLSVTGLLEPILSQPAFPDGVTFLVKDIAPITPAAYNADIELIINFGSNLAGQPQQVVVPVFSYEPALDPPQTPTAALHGRYSGQWTVEGLPRSGLLVQVGEVQPDRNFIFAIWFTYLDGFPIWVVGNIDITIPQNEVVIPMSILEGGGFITEPGTFTRDDVTPIPVGTMTLRAIHCNQLEADIDFSQGGLGTESLTFQRFIRIAGYDCDQTQ